MGGVPTTATSSSTTSATADSAEAQYRYAKVSVWWDIENCHVPKNWDAHTIAKNMNTALSNMGYCGPISISAYGDTSQMLFPVQRALNSTGVALNHIPAGVKDASDKKILVDMLLWAVDNPAPANYLLISGDRDFSNALHQLRMRKYNILLAQPQRASAPLVAAANSVWLWTSLLAGGPPLTKANLMYDNTTPQNSVVDVSHNSVSESTSTSKGIDFSYENTQFHSMGTGVDSKNKEKQFQKKVSQPNISVSPEVLSNGSPSKPGYASTHAKQYKDPQELFIPCNVQTHSSPIRSSINSSQPIFRPVNVLPPDPRVNIFNSMPPRAEGPRFNLGFPTIIPDIGKLSISGNPRSDRMHSTSEPQNGVDSKFNYTCKPTNYITQSNQQGGHIGNSRPLFYNASLNSKLSNAPESVASTSSVSADTNMSDNGIERTLRCARTLDYVQGLVGLVLLALNTLKIEKIMPTEANIADCIRYGDLRKDSIDTIEAIESAIEQQSVVKQKLGALTFYIRKNENLWHCVNPIGGDPNEFSKATWDKIQNFLASSIGQSAIMASQCRYEAATIMKQMCLNDLALGDIIRILHLVVTAKKWIRHLGSGWQPLNITIPETLI